MVGGTDDIRSSHLDDSTLAAGVHRVDPAFWSGSLDRVRTVGGSAGKGELLQLEGVEVGGIHFHGVFLNGLHSLRRFKLRNVAQGSSKVVVRLGSTVGDQVRFQLNNPNCPSNLAEDLRYIATNTDQAASHLSSLESNALFDAVGFVREVTLGPGETKDIIVSFRPEASHSRSTPLHPSMATGSRGDAISEIGLSSISVAEDSSLASTPGVDSTSTVYEVATVEGFLNFDASVVPHADEDAATTTLLPIQQLSIPLHATVCRSHFAISLAKQDQNEVFIDWGNQCVVGEVYVRDFEILNRSGIELFWRLDDPEGVASGRSVGSPFLVADIEKGHWLGGIGSEWSKPSSIPPYGSRKHRFIFRPEQAKDLDAEIGFENIGDPDNIIQVHFHASVSAAPRDNTLRLLSGSTLDFGNCVAGEWSQQVIVFKNVADAGLEVSFGADKGIEVTFRLEGHAGAEADDVASDDLDPTSIGANAVELPSLAATRAVDTVQPTSSGSRTIIHELARAPRGSTLSLLPTINAHHPSPFLNVVDSDRPQTLSPTSSEVASDSFSDDPPRTYHHHPLHPLRDIRSPLNPLSAELPVLHSLDKPPSQTSSSLSVPPLLRSTPSTRTGTENSKSGLYRVQDHLKVFERQNASRITDLFAKPGVESRILVSYRPTKATSIEADPDGARLVKKTFRLTVSYRPWSVRSKAVGGSETKERKAIVCKARVCTSFIKVSPEVMDFGEVELGTSREVTLSIENLSEIMARVDLRFISKVLSAYRDEITIEPGKTIDVRLCMVPRRINPAYQKQVSCHNLLNSENSPAVVVKSINVDTRGVAFHSLFNFRLLTSTGGGWEDFGAVPVGAVGLRGVAIHNTSDKTLGLELECAHPEDYELYIRRPEVLKPSPPGSTDDVATASPSRPPLPDSVPSAPPAVDTTLEQGEDRVERKERVLDALFAPSNPAVPRRQPNSTSSTVVPPTPEFTRAATITLKEGGKIKATQAYGSGMAFKDRAVLSATEWLDLASGPPLASSRMSPRSKRSILLDAIERTGRAGRPPPLSFGPARGSNLRSSSTAAPIRRDADMSPTGESTPIPPTTPTKRKAPRPPKDALSASSSSSPALTARRRTRNVFPLPTDPAKLSLDEVLAALEAHSAHPDSSELNEPELEEAYVKRFVALRRAFKAALKSGELVKVDSLDVPPQAEQIVYIFLHPSGVRTPVEGIVRKQDGKITMRLRCSPPSLSVDLPPLEVPSREVVLRWTTCRSTMDLGLTHLNFGTLDKSSSKEKKILISNASEIPLLYAVRKSGSIASGDIRLAEGRHGMIGPWGKREVALVFNPHYAGAFDEMIHVDNCADGSESSMRVKAFIRQSQHFSVTPSSLDFGECPINTPSHSLSFSISNTSKAPRTFTVVVEPSDFAFPRSTIHVMLDPAEGQLSLPTLTTEEEEEVEGVLQKLKISRRKGQPEKVEKYLARLTVLGVPLPAQDDVEPTIDAPIKPSPVITLAPILAPASTPLANGPTSITFTLNPNSRRDVSIALLPTTSPSNDTTKVFKPTEDISGTVALFDTENRDRVERLTLRATVLLA